jgi:hypothetical protein
LFRILPGLRRCAPSAFFFAFVQPLLDAILRVDQSFACITHSHLLSKPQPQLAATSNGGDTPGNLTNSD